jgi:hypothetical protein
MTYVPNLGLVRVKLAVDTAIGPLLNNGKTEAKAGEEAVIYIQDYLEMQTWPENQRPERLDYVDVNGVPLTPASNPGDQIRAEAAAKGILATDSAEVQAKKK